MSIYSWFTQFKLWIFPVRSVNAYQRVTIPWNPIRSFEIPWNYHKFPWNQHKFHYHPLLTSIKPLFLAIIPIEIPLKSPFFWTHRPMWSSWSPIPTDWRWRVMPRCCGENSPERTSDPDDGGIRWAGGSRWIGAAEEDREKPEVWRERSDEYGLKMD